MSKKRKTVTIDPEVKAYLDAEGRNASQTVNRLVKLDMGEEAVNEELIKMRMEMEEDKYKDAANDARRHLERYNELKDRLETKREKAETEFEQTIQSCVESFGYLPDSPDDPAIQNKAESVGVTPETFYEALTEEWNDA